MRVHAMSREDAEAYEPYQPYEVCISILSPEDPVYEVEAAPGAELSDRFFDVLRLRFHDVDENIVDADHLDEDSRERLADRLMTEEQALEAAQFVGLHVFDVESPDADAVIVHCEAGVSRSVGMARAISEWMGASPDSSRALHGRGNLHVRRRTLEALNRWKPNDFLPQMGDGP